ncbi:MAG: hypothetical protein CVT47_03490, partial [Thermoplasmata archaeon HGW-Thermoplasmata-2]
MKVVSGQSKESREADGWLVTSLSSLRVRESKESDEWLVFSGEWSVVSLKSHESLRVQRVIESKSRRVLESVPAHPPQMMYDVGSGKS